MKNAFCKMCVAVCGKFVPDEGVVSDYDNRIQDKSPAKWGVQIAGMILGARSRILVFIMDFPDKSPQMREVEVPENHVRQFSLPGLFCL